MSAESGMEQNESKPDFWSRIKKIPGIGILLAIVAGFFFSTGSLTVKLVTSISGVEAVFFRSIVIGISSMIAVIFKRQSLRPREGEKISLLLRITFGSFGMILSYSAIKLLPLGDSYAISSASTVFVTIFACILLKEPCGFIHIGFIFLAVSGIILIAKPSFLFPADHDERYADTRALGSLLAFGTSLTMAGAVVTIRALRTTPTAVVVVWYAVFAALSSLIYCLIRGELVLPKSNTEYGLLFLCGACGTLGQGLMTLALKLENAASISLAGTCEILIAFIFQITLLDGEIPWTSAVGGAILLLGIVSTALHKWYQTDPMGFKKNFFCQQSDLKSDQQPSKESVTRIRTFSTMSTVELA